MALCLAHSPEIYKNLNSLIKKTGYWEKYSMFVIFTYWLEFFLHISEGHCISLSTKVTSSWHFSYWTCWSIQLHLVLSTCRPQLIPWGGSTLKTWGVRRTITRSVPMHRASWPTSCSPGNLPRELKVRKVSYHYIFFSTSCLFFSVIVAFLCMKIWHGQNFLPMWESHVQTTSALGNKKNEERQVF